MVNGSQQPKSILVAYLLWLGLGLFGAHRFYLKRDLTGFTQAALAIAAIVVIVVGVVIVVVPWVDFFITFPLMELEHFFNCAFATNFDMCPNSVIDANPDLVPFELSVASIAGSVALLVIGLVLLLAVLIWWLVDSVLTYFIASAYNQSFAVFQAATATEPEVDIQRIYFYDGVCVICNRYVDFMLPRIAKMGMKNLHFAPLQGATATRLLTPADVESLRTLVLWEGFLDVDKKPLNQPYPPKVYRNSSGVLRSLEILGGAWRLVKPFYLVPPFIRDFLYRLIANNRYSLFGKRDTCRLPTPKYKEYFWD